MKSLETYSLFLALILEKFKKKRNKGSGIFEINGVEHDVSVGTFMLMAPFEKHGIWIPKDKESPLRVVVTGVVVD